MGCFYGLFYSLIFEDSGRVSLILLDKFISFIYKWGNV